MSKIHRFRTRAFGASKKNSKIGYGLARHAEGVGAVQMEATALFSVIIVVDTH